MISRIYLILRPMPLLSIEWKSAEKRDAISFSHLHTHELSSMKDLFVSQQKTTGLSLPMFWKGKGDERKEWKETKLVNLYAIGLETKQSWMIDRSDVPKNGCVKFHRRKKKSFLEERSRYSLQAVKENHHFICFSPTTGDKPHCCSYKVQNRRIKDLLCSVQTK